MIDLHLHTTASDGRSQPGDLVCQAAEAGITVLSVTDHDTLAATQEVAARAAALDMETVAGIEITAVHVGRDVHVLGYFLDIDSVALAGFLRTQREDRVRRVAEIGNRLGALGVPIDADALITRARRNRGRSVGRPQIARALVRAGHVRSVREAFDRLLGEGRPAFVSRRGASPARVIRLIRDAGGLASLAHPGLLGADEVIPALAQAGLGALEAYHGEHSVAMRRHYCALARSLDLAVSGGSDFHGTAAGRPNHLGRVTLPEVEFARLRHRAAADRDAGPAESPLTE